MSYCKSIIEQGRDQISSLQLSAIICYAIDFCPFASIILIQDLTDPMSYVSTYSQWKMSLTWNKHYNFLIKRVSLTILPLKVVNSNMKYNGMGYLPCNGYVPCQVILVISVILMVMVLKDKVCLKWIQISSNELISAGTSFKEAQGRENGQCDALSWLQGGVLSNLTYMNAIFPIFDVAANIAHSDFYFSILSITIWLWHQQKGQKVTLFVI